jgi:phosphatidylglycerophosphatase C
MDERDRPLAAFDFDGTLTRGDCMVLFLRRLVGTPRVAAALTRVAPHAARGGRDAAKERVLAGLLTGADASAVDAHGAAFAEEVLARRLRADTVRRLRWHQDEGHRTVLVSASLRPYLRPIAEHLDIDHLICTELEVVDGRLTGRIAGGNCRGQAKADRLVAWNGGPPRRMWAYGDSSGDTQLLALAHWPERVSRRTALAPTPTPPP